MRKFVLIPIITLGRKEQVNFFEVYSEPAFYGIDDRKLKNSGIVSEINQAKKAIKLLAYPRTPACHLYQGNHFINLSSLSYISLGLVLAVFMQHRDCRFKKIMSIGGVITDSLHLLITGGNYLVKQVPQIVQYSRHCSSLALFLPENTYKALDCSTKSKLACSNISVFPVNNLYEALTFMGINMIYRPELVFKGKGKYYD